MQNSPISCCCLYKQAKPKLCSHDPNSQAVQNVPASSTCSGIELFASAARSDEVLSSAYWFCHVTCKQPSALWSHVTFSRTIYFWVLTNDKDSYFPLSKQIWAYLCLGRTKNPLSLHTPQINAQLPPRLEISFYGSPSLSFIFTFSRLNGEAQRQ